jgi:hypothetical protein
MVLVEGWNTITVDLADDSRPDPNGLYDDEAASYGSWTSISPKVIRFDPHEIPNSAPLTFSIDDIKLTAKDISSGSFDVLWTKTDPDDAASTVKLYYATVPDGTGTLFATVTNGIGSYHWRTASLSNGEYYIRAEVSDGLNTTSWWSESPLVVSRPVGEYLVVTPSSFSLMAEVNNGKRTIGKMIVDNYGLAPMNWSITAPSWIDVAPANGTNGPTVVTVTPDSTGLGVGIYGDVIIVDGGGGGTQYIPVTLFVVDSMYVDYLPVMRK